MWSALSGIVLLGMLVSVGLGHFVISSVLKNLRNREPKTPNTEDTCNWLLGIVERLVYTIVFLMGKDYIAFIVFWLTIKGIGRWVGNGRYGIYGNLKNAEAKEEYELDAENTKVVNLYLIGNLLSIIFSAFGAIIIKYLGGIDLSNIF